MERSKNLLRNSSKATFLSFLHLQPSLSVGLPSKKILWRRPHELLRLPYKVTILVFRHRGRFRCSQTHLLSRQINQLSRFIPISSSTHLRLDLHIQAPLVLAYNRIMAHFPTCLTSASPHPPKSYTSVPVKQPQPKHHPHLGAPVYPRNAAPGLPKKKMP